MKAGEQGNNWTPEKVEQAKRLFSAGLSASQIAAEVGGVSRNAVLGKLHRLGLKRSENPTAASANGHFSRRERKPRMWKPRLRLVASKPLAATLPAGTGIILDHAGILATRVSLLDARNDQCRWPAADDGSAAMVCGAKIFADGKSWCAHHARRSIWRPSTGRTVAA